jgi:aryl-alcohol dehydrogenase-like predicted oxidoreductase
MPERRISRIGFGGARLGSISNPLSMRECQRLLDQAIDMGINLFDTANIYGQGDSERLIGRAVKGRRDEMTLVTKAGQRFSTKMRLIRPLKPLVRMLPRSDPGTRRAIVQQRNQNIGKDFTAGSLARELEGSLRRLQTDHVDIFLLHSPPLDVVMDPRTAEALAQLIDRGFTRKAGVSTDEAEVALAALSVPVVSALQMPMGLLETLRPRLSERDPFLMARGIVGWRGERSVRQAYADAVADPQVDTALIDTTSPARLAELAGLP